MPYLKGRIITLKNRLITTFTALAMLLSQFAVFASDNAVNVALNMQASASSELSGENAADKANDGINDNESYTYYMSNAEDEMPWWQVDLGLSFPVSKIEIEARKGSNNEAERKNFRIIGANKDDFTDSVVLAENSEDYGEKFVCDFSTRQVIRYVKVEKTAAEPLSIGEIRVLAEKNEIPQGAETGVAGSASADESMAGAGTAFSDIAGTKYESPVRFLNALGIMNGYPDGTFRSENEITRAEFTKIAAKLYGMTATNSSPTFSDVAEDHWAYSYIETMASAKVIDGVGNGRFAPDDVITTNQTVKILVALLGYKEIAEFNGGYPDGYVKIANQLKLYKGAGEIGESITRGQIAIMVKNAVETDVLRQTTFGDKSEASTIPGVTLLSENLDIYQAEGVVDAVRGTSLTDANDEGDSTYLTINGYEYFSKIDNIESFFGSYVDFWYYKSENRPYEILLMVLDKSNTIVEIDAEDIISANSDQVEYYDGDKKKKVSISDSADVIYNGFALRDYTEDDLWPLDGKIRLVDNDNDNDFDVYIVNKIDTYVVNRVNSAKNIISVKNGATVIEINESYDMTTITNASTGIEAEIGDIKEWDVLSVTESYTENGSKYYDILISDKYIDGVLETIGDDYIVIDGEKYETVPGFDFSEVQVGDEGVFYADAYNRIAAYDGSAVREGEYGFLKAMKVTDGISPIMQFRIFTTDGSFVTLDAHKKKFKVDGIKYTDSDFDSVFAHLKRNEYISDSVAQPVKFVRDGQNRITSIDTVYVGEEGEESFSCDSPLTNRYWKHTGIMTVVATGGEQVAVGGDTVMFKVPADIFEEDDFEIVSTASLSSDSQYSVAVYDSGAEKIAGLLVLGGAETVEAVAGNRLMLVEEVVVSLNEEGEIVAKVCGLYHGNRVEFSEKEQGIIDVDDLVCGDVISLSLTAGNLIKGYTKRWYKDGIPEDVTTRAVSPDEPYGCLSGTNDELCLVYGKVLTMKDSIITVGPEDDSAYEPIVVSLYSPELKIYRYDSEEEKIYTASPDEIFDAASSGSSRASRVLVRISCRQEYELIIFD
ncbi:MAG: hypothetical protein E7412_01040 [Ruminococcaceae bacterium]|nr:hypothetical protein [Oscillospiraceae bacterium]